ncbi:Beta-defensin 132, partial [Heterocephalus glaber]
MKSLLLVFAALRFLAELASADRGGTRLAQNDLGECSLICSWNEWLTLLYDRYRQCCVESDFLPMPIMPQHVDKSKSLHRKTTQ